MRRGHPFEVQGAARIEAYPGVGDGGAGGPVELEFRAAAKGLVGPAEVTVVADPVVIRGAPGEPLEFRCRRQSPLQVFLEETVWLAGRLPVPGGQSGLGLEVFGAAERAAEKYLVAGHPDQFLEVPGSLLRGDVLEHVEADGEIETVVLERQQVAVEMSVGVLAFHVYRGHFRAGEKQSELAPDPADVEDRSRPTGQSGDD